MKIELKPIIDQLTEALGIREGYKVAAVTEDDALIEWTIVKVYEDGGIKELSASTYKTINELFINKEAINKVVEYDANGITIKVANEDVDENKIQ